jgi:hypothetical protein
MSLLGGGGRYWIIYWTFISEYHNAAEVQFQVAPLVM